jgi:spectinomycin phosphotransferase
VKSNQRQPPDLAEDRIVAALWASFGIRVAALVLLAIGNDADSWAYRVQAAPGPVWFLKLRAGANPTRGAAVPSYLHGHGVPNVLAPLATGTGAPYVLVDRFALALYPMLEAQVGAEIGLSPAQWRQLGAAVRRVHAVPLTPELRALVDREAFRPTRRALLADLEVRLAAPADPVAGELAGFWRTHGDVIDELIQRADALGRQLARGSSPQVLCHADLHTWNVLVDTDRFFEGYGQASVDRRLLAYYRCAWAVQDIAAYAEQVPLAPGLGEATRRAAVAGFMDLFAPGNIVDLARAPDAS